MRLLLDQNLSPKLVGQLEDLYPSSQHVRDVGLAEADDVEIWSYAADQNLAIVSKDNDFVQLSLLRGAPPKVIRLQVGNCTTAKVGAVLRTAYRSVVEFGDSAEASLLVLPVGRRITSP